MRDHSLGLALTILVPVIATTVVVTLSVLVLRRHRLAAGIVAILLGVPVAVLATPLSFDRFLIPFDALGFAGFVALPPLIFTVVVSCLWTVILALFECSMLPAPAHLTGVSS
jgi:hypothetical protein